MSAIAYRVFRVEVTNPKYEWKGVWCPKGDPQIIAILAGKRVEHPEALWIGTAQERRERFSCADKMADIVTLFFEWTDGAWRAVPLERFGTGPYVVGDILLSHFGHMIRECADTQEYRTLLRDLGLVIDGQMIEP